MPVSDQRAAPSPLTAGITTQEKFQRPPAPFHHPAPAGIRSCKNRLSNVKTAAPRRPGNGPAKYANPRRARHPSRRPAGIHPKSSGLSDPN